MSYKIIDGVAYEVKEVSLDSVKGEVADVVKVIDAVNAKKTEIMANRDNTSKQYDAQIANYQKQLDALNKVIGSLEERKAEALEPYKSQLEECDLKINVAKSSLIEKKELIEALMPEEAKKLAL